MLRRDGQKNSKQMDTYNNNPYVKNSYRSEQDV